jgi:P-type Cu+ transporter
MTQQTVDLQIGGMTCASCAARIEKKLNRMPGVQASVNYATEKAHVVLPDGTDVGDAIATVEATGYTATLPAPPKSADSDVDSAETTSAEPAEVVSLRRRLQVSIALTIPVFLLAMIPPLQFDNWQWLSLTLAAPVVVWGAWPFHRAAWLNARHGAATMDTLISIGVLAAFGWSLYALFLGGAGMPGMRMTFSWFTRPGAGADEIYLEVATAVTVFILAGRYF